jgi:oligopeptide/dipeptide ABC transporter ATP-binding protein
MTPLLQVNKLKVSFKHHFKKIDAVREVSFDLFPKETVAIVGESGCGKSVLIKAILKLFSSSASIQAEKILYGELDLNLMTEKELQKIRGKEIGVIFQDPMTSLNPTMKIGDQILENILLHKGSISFQDAKNEVLNLLALVGITDAAIRYNQYPHELSGGMRQRVMIAIALAPSPKILIADEPTTALDVTIQAQILSLLKKIQETRGTSILLITHDLSIVAGFCDKVMVMYAGKIVEVSDTASLFKDPKHPYTIKLLKSLPRLDVQPNTFLQAIAGVPPDLSTEMQGCSFAPRCFATMEVCTRFSPPSFRLEKRECACWLLDPRAPGVKQ